ncbi:MAG: permease prefix domain 1-containing protein, partial [Candidatus Acidiferrum sp.]
MFSGWLTKSRARIKALLNRRELDRDLHDEFAFHLAMRQEKNFARGMEPKEARYAAPPSR